MYNTGVPEKLIAEKSGHKSLQALRVYEHTSEVQDKSAGQCIHSGTCFDPISLIEDKENCNPVPSVAPTSCFLVLVFRKQFSSFLASLAAGAYELLLAALSTFTSLNLTHFGAFMLLPITVAHCCS